MRLDKAMAVRQKTPATLSLFDGPLKKWLNGVASVVSWSDGNQVGLEFASPLTVSEAEMARIMKA